MLDLRVIERNCLLDLTSPHTSRLGNSPHRSEPPKGKKNKTKKEKPGVDRAAVLELRPQLQCPWGRLHSRRFPWIAHVIGTRQRLAHGRSAR